MEGSIGCAPWQLGHHPAALLPVETIYKSSSSLFALRPGCSGRRLAADGRRPARQHGLHLRVHARARAAPHQHVRHVRQPAPAHLVHRLEAKVAVVAHEPLRPCVVVVDGQDLGLAAPRLSSVCEGGAAEEQPQAARRAPCPPPGRRAALHSGVEDLQRVAVHQPKQRRHEARRQAQDGPAGVTCGSAQCASVKRHRASRSLEPKGRGAEPGSGRAHTVPNDYAVEGAELAPAEM
mmetsp:Transcript_33002/g.84322  ORF Transcript_33002/g.84322 Transcript_33002/m.84322 type:complete len:235 (-) Transcript_33002:50-754(-)